MCADFANLALQVDREQERGIDVVKLVLLFKKPSNEDDFEDYYVRNLALLEKLPGIMRRQANIILGSPSGNSPYYRILELYFETFEALDAAMTSAAGVMAGQQLMKSVGNQVEIMFAEVFDDPSSMDGQEAS